MAAVLVLVLCLFCMSGLSMSAFCTGKPDPNAKQNMNPIYTAPPTKIKSVVNGKLYTLGQTGINQFHIVHVWGTPYDMGKAHGQLLNTRVVKFIDNVWQYLEEQVIGAINSTVHNFKPWFLKDVVDFGLDVALDLEVDITRKYTGKYFFEEAQGLSDGSGVDLKKILRIHMIGELTKGDCSMFGAWGKSVPVEGSLLQLRALDWDVDGPFNDFPQVTVYHPIEGNGHAFANFGWTGWIGSITGMSSKRMAISEIGVTFPDETFGSESRFGVPFTFLLRDILQFDETIDDSINRIVSSPRTCDLILGVGDGKIGEFRGIQYSASVANFIDDMNLKPNATWHPKIKDVVYFAMDWLCPSYSETLSRQLNKHYGNITAENVIRDITAITQTGNLQIAIYDLTNNFAYLANAKSTNETGPLYAYERYLQTTEDEINSQGVPENPIDAFHLLRRWVQDWEKCFERVFCDDCVEDGPAIDFNLTRGIIQKHLNGWPSQKDIDAAITALFRLWDTYEFKLEDLFHGKLYNFKTKPFTPEDILYIANKAEDRKDMYTSVRFLETLLDEFKKGNFPDSSLSVIRIAKATASAYNRNDMPWKSVEILKEYIELEPENKRLRADYDYFKTKADSIPESERISILEKADKDLLKVTPTIDYDVDIIKKYRALCRGHVKTNEELSRLYCYYKETEIPIYRVKVEMANLQPKVFLFHDVISEYEMNFMKNASTPKLERSVVLHETNAQAPAESRISRTAWLLDTDYPLLQKISKRVKLITGLETEYKSRFSNAEQYQVLNYGIGGMYRPHIDPLNTRAYDKNQAINPDDTKYSGDRIATFMFYLSDVMYGGATVFPKLNARVPVQKGCAAFWYNLDLNGDVNTNMTHAGCPVLVGSKWVSNKWIREIGQAFRRRCGLKRNSKDRRR